MDQSLFQELNDYSLNCDLTKTTNKYCKKVERIVTKDSEWPEIHSVITAGFNHNDSKLGFDGYFEETFCEAKSQSLLINKDIIYKYHHGKISDKASLLKSGTISNHAALAGRGFFNAFTYRLFKRYQENDVTMLLSGYVNGVLLYMISFNFNDPVFLGKMKEAMQKKLPNGDKINHGAKISFSYLWYKDCESLEVLYVSKNANRNILKAVSTKKFFIFLMENHIDEMDLL